jgi:hypothetical protein
MIRAARYHAGIRVSVSVPMTFVLRKNHSASALRYLKSQFRGRMKVTKFTFDSSVKQKGFDFIRMETPNGLLRRREQPKILNEPANGNWKLRGWRNLNRVYLERFQVTP